MVPGGPLEPKGHGWLTAQKEERHSIFPQSMEVHLSVLDELRA